MRTRVPWLACLALSITSCRLLPEAPTGVAALAGARHAVVRWNAPPQQYPLAPITYTVVASPGGASVSTTALQGTVGGLADGTTYTFTVVARNRFGASDPSAPSAPVTTPVLPGAPTGVVAVAGDGQATVTWEPPASDGGSAITAYAVTAIPGGQRVTAPGLGATVTGLTNGGAYAFTVAAITAVGTGPAAAFSAPVLPAPAVAFDTAEVPVGSTASALDPSWKWGPFMHVFVRAYRDSNGDGEGDLPGLIEKLDYLKDLGIRGILLLPIFANQDRDHGYLTTNFRDVAPDYGSLADLDRLLAEAHARGIGVILDAVLQYSGSAHPGFVSASGSAASPWRDWYVWSAGDPGWASWWWEAPTGWYYGFYGQANPVFDWKNPAVRAYHRDTLRYWLNRGVDGFRLDAVQTLVQNGPDAWWDQPEDYAFAAELRQVVEGYDNRLLLCEAPWSSAAYAGSDVCGGGFLFSLVGEQREDGSTAFLQAAVLAAAQRGSADALWRLAYDPVYAPIGSMGTLLGNHDRFVGKRIWNQLGGDTPAYRLASATLLLMPGAPFLYYGEEVGMAETLLPTADPERDHHQRGVMSWTGDPARAGFSERTVLDGPAAIADPDDKYLVPVPNAVDHNVEVEQADPRSLLEWYRSLIGLRHAHRALARGLYRPLAVDTGAWAFARSDADEEILVAINYQAAEVSLWLGASPGTYQVLKAFGVDPAALTVGEDGAAVLTLPPQSLVVYRQAREVAPFGDLYVRGSFNGWEAAPGFQLAYVSPGRYQGNLLLPAGASWFDLTNADWQPRVDLGLIGGGEVMLGEPRALEQTGWWSNGSAPALTFRAPVAGLYEFTLTVDDPYRPVLTVQPGPELPAPEFWQRPAQPPAPSAVGLSYVQAPDAGVTWFFSEGELLALFNNRGNTFIEFWVDGANVLGGFARGQGLTNEGPGVRGHGAGYPYGQIDPITGQPGGLWLGFWAGYGYIDTRWMRWNGVNGGPAELVFDVQPTADGRLDVHVVTENGEGGLPLFQCDVHYVVSRAGIGVRSEVSVLSDLYPWGQADTGGQLLMTQVDSDLDPDLPWDTSQPDLYFQLALDGYVQPLRPFPPYDNAFTPSNVYTDYGGAPPYGATALPDGARVLTATPVTYLTAMGRASRPVNLALRIDQARSTLPPMEYYAEVNGDRDLLNFLYSAAVGTNGDVVTAGTAWRLYGDLLPWRGSDPEALRAVPMLSDGVP